MNKYDTHPSINRDAILEVLHNHYCLTQILWPFFDVTRAKSDLSRTVFILKLKGGPDYIKGKLIGFDNGVSV